MHSLWTSLFPYWMHGLSTPLEAKGCSFLPRELMPFLLGLLRWRFEWLWHSQVTSHCASNLFTREDRIRSFSSLWRHCPIRAYDVYGVKQVNLSEFLKVLWTVNPCYFFNGLTGHPSLSFVFRARCVSEHPDREKCRGERAHVSPQFCIIVLHCRGSAGTWGSWLHS